LFWMRRPMADRLLVKMGDSVSPCDFTRSNRQQGRRALAPAAGLA
jgi:hypothetical protein